MSGGYFNYAFHRVEQFADDLDAALTDPHQQEEISPHMRLSLTALSRRARHLAREMHAAEWYFSGDIGEETYRMTEVTRHLFTRYVAIVEDEECVYPSPDGPWVKYEDVEPLLDALRAWKQHVQSLRPLLNGPELELLALVGD